MHIILKTKFGSNLYGTDTPESDTDIKGIYLPDRRDVILGKVIKTKDASTNKTNEKNSAEDIDEEYYSLHYFLELAFKGETVALDMLHVKPEWNQAIPCGQYSFRDGFGKEWEHYTDLWDFLHQHRSSFYTKNMKSYLGYCLGQAAKYGVKGSRLADARKVLNFLHDKTAINPRTKVADYWDEFPEGEHILKHANIETKNTNQDQRAIEVCNRMIMVDTKVWYALEMVQKFCNSYGDRARKAELNIGIDFKSVSHAFRAGYQLKEIYETGDLQYPLKDRDFLRDLKQGKFHYQNDGIGQKLEDLMQEVKDLAEASDYPEQVDRKFFEDWLVSLYD